MTTHQDDTTADQVAALADIRRRPAYCLARAWLEIALAGADLPFTKGLRVSVGSATIIFKASFVGSARARAGHYRPTIAAALADQDAEVSVALALHDAGARVDLARDSCTRERLLACNVKERLLWALFRSRSQSGHLESPVSDAAMSSGSQADLAFLREVHGTLAEHQRLLRQRGEHERAAAVEGLALDAYRRAAALARSARVPVLQYIGPERGTFVVGTTGSVRRWECRSAGAHVLALAALNPRQWLRLPAGRDRKAWARTIGNALDSLALIDLDAANMVAPAGRANAPGVRLRNADGRVEVRWTPPPGVGSLVPGVALPAP